MKGTIYEKYPTWVNLINAAHVRWNSELAGKSYEEFLTYLSAEQEYAVLLSNFNYQVENGGLFQWIDNGYCLQIKKLILVLTYINSENFLKVVEILEKIIPFVNLDEKGHGMGNYFNFRKNSGKIESDIFIENLEYMTKDFHSYRKEWMDEVESYLKLLVKTN